MKKYKCLISIMFSSISFISPIGFLFKENKNYEISNVNFSSNKNAINENSIKLTINSDTSESFDFKLKINENLIDINSLKDLSKNNNYFSKVEDLISFDFQTNNDKSKQEKIKNYSLNLLSILFQAYYNENTRKISFYKDNALDSVEKEINFFEGTTKNITSKKLKSTLSKEQNKIKITLKDVSNANKSILFEWEFSDTNRLNKEISFINQLNDAIKIIDVSKLFNFSLESLDINKNYYTYSYDMFDSSNNMNNQIIKTLMYAINKPKNNPQNSQEVNELINNIDTIDLKIKEMNSSSMPIKEYERTIKFSNNNKIDYSFLDLPFEKDVTITNIKVNTNNSIDSTFLNSSIDINMKMQTEKDKLNNIHLSNSIDVNIEDLYKKIDNNKNISENLKTIENEIKNNPLSIKFFEIDDLLSVRNNVKMYDDLYKLVIQKAFDNMSDWYHINLSYIWVDYKNKKGYIRLIITSNDGKELINTFIKRSDDNNAPNSGGGSSSNGNSVSGNNSIANGGQENNYQYYSNASVDKWIIYVAIEIILIILVISIIFVILNKNKNKDKI